MIATEEIENIPQYPAQRFTRCENGKLVCEVSDLSGRFPNMFYIVGEKDTQLFILIDIHRNEDLELTHMTYRAEDGTPADIFND